MVYNHFSTLQKLSIVLAVCIFSFLINPFSTFSQSSDLPSWNGKQMQIPADYQPREIKDIFAEGAVHFDDLVELAKFMPYIKDEIVVAVQHNIEPSLAIKYFNELQWSKYLLGVNASFINVVLTNKTAGKTVSLVHLQLPSGTDVMQVAEKIKLTNGLLWVSPNFYYDGDPRDYTPNDSLYSMQYHHVRMQNNLAWDISKGNPDIVVAVTDDGVQLLHDDLAPNIWVNSDEIAGDGVDNDNNGYVDDVNGWDFSFNNNNPNPNSGSNSHGTHVGGIIGARIDNITGIAGVAGLTTIMPLQFYGTGGASWTSTVIANTFAYAVANGAKILNCSYNIDGFASNPVFIAATQHLLDNNVIYFNSAGNNNQENPARQVITQGLLVTSTTSTDTRSSFSNYGVGMDVAAPGSSIYSTVQFNTYQSQSGTSMSTPNAAGAAALIWGHNPTWNAYQVAAQLLGTADNIAAQNPTTASMLGSGRVNTFKALTNTLPPPRVKSLNGLPTGSISISGAPSGFTLAFNQVMDAPSINNPSNIELRNAGPNNIFNDGDDVVFGLTSQAPYRIGTNIMTYTIDQDLTCGSYRFTIVSNGVKNPFNTALDGNNDGTGGDNFVQEFSIDQIYFLDNDGDGYGQTSSSVIGSCTSTPAGYSLFSGDCNDSNPNINPGVTEVCNSIDDNCDGLIDLFQQTLSLPSTDSVANVLPGVGTGNTSGARASIYPSIITVAGFTGQLQTVAIKLNGVSHSWFNDLDFLLQSPSGDKMIIYSDVGSGGSAGQYANFSFTISDDGVAPPTNTQMIAGVVYKPTNFGLNDFFSTVTGTINSPVPAGIATLTSVFGGTDPNGEWKLFIVDDASGDAGSLDSWELILYTQDTVCVPVAVPQVAVTQPDCTNNFGTIEFTSPIHPSYTYSVGGAFQSSPIFTNLNPGSYTVSVKDDQGNISHQTVVVINVPSGVPETPSIINGMANVCEYIGTSTVLNYFVDPVNNATNYMWTFPTTVTHVSGQGTNAIQLTVNANFNTNNDRTISVVASNGCGTSGATSLRLIKEVPTTPSEIVASSTDICASILSNTPITYTIPKVPGATSYNWIISMAGVTSVVHPNAAGEHDTSVVITFTNAFTTRSLQVNAVNSCGVSSNRSLDLVFSLNVATPGLISGPTNVCEFVGNGSPLATYSVPNVNGFDYTWTLPAGSSNLVNNRNEVSFNFPANFSGGSISVVATNGCGVSQARVLNVVVQLPATPGAITSVELQDCPDRIIRHTIDPVNDPSLDIIWTVPSGATIISGEFTNSITASYPSTAVVGIVTVQLQSSCGNSGQSISYADIEACETTTGTTVTGLQVNVFPNPSTTSSNLEILSNVLEDVFIRIYDVKGRLISKIRTAPNTIVILQENLIPGVYVIKVQQGDQKRVKKFLKH